MTTQKTRQRLWASKMARDCVARATDPSAKILENKDWRILRKDLDTNHKEEFQRTFAEEEGYKEDNNCGGSGSGRGFEGRLNSCSTYAFELDEEAENYQDCLPMLAERLFKALDVIRERGDEDLDMEMVDQDLEGKFNRMAEILQTEHLNLEQRTSDIAVELKESKANLKSIFFQLKDCQSILRQCSSSKEYILLSDILQVMKNLTSITEEFDLYSSLACRNARRMGMLDVENRIHKMLDVMILYSHSMNAKLLKLEADYEQIVRRTLLEENRVTMTTFSPTTTTTVTDPTSEDENVIGTMNSVNRGTEQKFRWATEIYEIFSSDMFWPWSVEEMMKSMKKIFSVLLMILGVIVFIRGIISSSTKTFS